MHCFARFLSMFVLSVFAVFHLPIQTVFAAPPNVVVTIKPIHSLAIAVMDGIATPKLLLSSAASAHTYALRPSDAEVLTKAGVIVRVSKNLEVFLERALRILPNEARIIDVEDAPGLTLLHFRKSGAFVEGDAHDSAQDSGNESHRHAHGPLPTGTDVHLWLHPLNAIKISAYMAAKFSEIDPANAARYKANSEALEAKLIALDDELRMTLAPLKGKPFIVFHDVMQYFENLYGLTVAGTITLSPDRQPGARRLGEIRAKIVELGAVCVLAEPQFPTKLVATLVDGTSARTGTFDEVGVDVPPGRNHYFTFMRKNASNLIACTQG